MYQTKLFRPILPEDQFIGRGRAEDVQALAHAMGEMAPEDLDGYVELALERLRQRASEGMIGVKGTAFQHISGDAAAAASALRRVVAGKGAWPDTVALVAYLRDRLYEECGKLDVVVVKHSGVWAGGWSDHTTIRPTNIIAVALAHRGTRFDLFHAGTPWPADAGLVARSLPNVYLNLCWSHLISPTLARHALHTWLDMIPVNKVLGFGGDYWWAVENVYGSLMQTRRLLARVLGERMARGEMTEGRALQIARLWMHDNPREAYFID
jgi:predicted TIM-barrel fold metal-dependent hydrolase